MAQKSLLEVPITTGLNQRADVRELQTSGAVAMSNCVVVNTGAVQKRLGNTQVSVALGGAGAAVAGGSYKGAPWASDGQYLYSIAEAAPGAFLVDAVPEAIVGDRLGLSSWLANAYDWDIAVVGSTLIYVMTVDTTNPSDTGMQALYYGVADLSTNATIISLRLVDATMTTGALAPKLIVCGSTVLLTYVDSVASTGLSVRTYDALFSLSFSAPTIVNVGTVGGNFASGIYDACAIAGDATHFMTVNEVTGASTVRFTRVNVSGLSVATSVVLDTVTPVFQFALASSTASGTFAAYNAKAGAPTVMRVSGLSTGLAAVTPVTAYTWSVGTGRLDIAITDVGQAMVVFSSGLSTGQTDYQNVSLNFVATLSVIASGGAMTAPFAADLRPSLMLYSRILVQGTSLYAVVYVPSASQGTMFLVRINRGAPPIWVATFSPRLTKYLANLSPSVTAPKGLTAPHIVADAVTGGSAYLVPVPESTSPSHSSIFAQRFDLASQTRLAGAELGELEALALGVPSAYDGQEVTELGYAHYPEVAATVSAGGSLGVGVYSYICTYEWYDARGQIHRSATSPAVTVTTTAGNNTVTINATTLGLTNRRAMVGLPAQKSMPYRIVYRTTANGTVFYRRTPDPPTAADQVSLSASTLSLMDIAADSTITSNAVLYTTGGALDNYCPPSARIAVTDGNRWYLAGGPDPSILWASKYLTQGEAPGFNEAQNTVCSGSIRAIAIMDDKRILFVQRGASYGIEYMAGLGPLDTGAQSDWTGPQQIPSDTGALNQRGVCVGPFGTLFRGTVGGPQNSGGIFLLTRDLQVKYLSGPVSATLLANPVVSSMLVHPRNGRVYITCAPSASSTTGVRLVWDYSSGGVWSVDQLNDVGGSQASTAVTCGFVGMSAVAGGPAYYWVAASGRVYRENAQAGANAFTDAGAFVSMTYASAWLKPGKSGFARFWRTLVSGDTLDPADVTVRLTYDYAPAMYYNEAHTWTAAQIATFDRAPQVDVQMTSGNQKAKAIQVTVSDAAPTGVALVTGQGVSLGAISLEIGVDEGASYRNIPAGQRS